MSDKVKNKKGAKYAVYIMLNFVWMFALYRVVLLFSQHINSIIPYAVCASVYLIAATLLLGIYYFSTSGETDKAKKEKYKPLFVWAFPIIVVLLLDVTETIILDYVINLFA